MQVAPTLQANRVLGLPLFLVKKKPIKHGMVFRLVNLQITERLTQQVQKNRVSRITIKQIITSKHIINYFSIIKLQIT